MAEATTKVQVPDQMSQLNQLMGLFKGFTTTGQKQTGTADPGALAALAQIASGFSKENAGIDANALIQAAMQSAAREFAPILGKERAAGMANVSSTGLQADQMAVARAGELARTLMQANAQYGSVAANAAGTAAQATRGVQTKPQTKIDPTAILTQAGGIGLMSLLKRMLAEPGKKTGGKALTTAAGSLFGSDAGSITTNPLAALNSFTSSLPGAFAPGGGSLDFSDVLGKSLGSIGGGIDYSLASDDLFSGIGNFGGFGGFGSFGSDLISDAFSPSLDLGFGGLDLFGDTALDAATGIFDFGTDFASSAGLDFGFDSALDFGFDGALDYGLDAGFDFAGSAATDLATDAGFSMGFPYMTALRVAGDVFDINEVQDLFGGINKGISTAFEGIGDVFEGVSVICTALYIHGEMPRELYRYSARDFARYARTHDVRGYYAIASRYLRLMKHSRLAFNFARTVFNLRALYIRSKHRNLPTPWLGYACYKALYGINAVASKCLQLFRRD